MLRYYDYNEKEDRLTVRCYTFCPSEKPCLVIRCDSRGKRLFLDRKASFSLSQVADEIYKLMSFLDNPHWKSTLRTDMYMRSFSESPSLL